MANEAYAEGNALFVEELYDEAVQAYTQAIDALVDSGDNNATLADVYAKRAAAYIKLNDHIAALDDARAALKLVPQHVGALYRKGLACFHMDEFETSKAAFEAAIANSDVGNRQLPVFRKWLRKCDAELDSDDEDVAAAIQHTQAAAAASATPGAGAGAGSSSPEDDTDAGTGSGASAAAAAAPAPTPAAAPAPAPAKRATGTMASKVRYDWYESLTGVTIDIMSKNIDEASSETNFSSQSLDISLGMQDGSNYLLDITLAGKIIPGKCTIKYRKVKAEVKLVKATQGEWGALEASQYAAATAAAVEDTPLPRPYAAKKDWDKIERDLEAEEKENKPEGEDALRGLFQQIYKDADEDTRRAMIKSFQTSGGTVLSTNWNEVAKEDYEKNRQAPDGMEWKKWG